MLTTQVIYCGDNLQKLRELPVGSVDLVYIDPAFKVDVDFETFEEESSFKPAWNSYGKVGQYIELVRPRVMALRQVLREHGSLYYHCDWRVEAYVRVMLDEIFGQDNFRSHIIWPRGTVKGRMFRSFQNTHDSIFFYSKSADYTFNPQYLPYNVEYIESYYKFIEPETGRRYRLASLTAQSKDAPQLTYELLGVTRTWRWKKERMQEAYDKGLIVQAKPGAVPMLKRYLDEQEGVPVDNIWTDILPVRSNSEESLGYPTQKPLELLERIIKASTNEDDVVLDAFCGSGTTLHAAQKLGRRWIGIDISPTACQISARRLEKNLRLEEGKDFLLRDLSKSVEELRDYSPLEFENWVINVLNTVLAKGGKIAEFSGSDTGIDLMIYSATEGRGKRKEGTTSYSLWLPVQVKRKEAVSRNDIQGFKTALRRQKCNKGLFVAFGFTEDAKAEIQHAFSDEGLDIKLLTVNDILSKDTIL